MQVILLERVEKLGQMGDEVRVKDGFARNFLLPKKKALRATKANEAGRTEPWMISDAPDAYIAQLLRVIVGFRLTITRLEGQWKMSQNKPASEREGVMDGLTREDAGDVLAIMKP